MPRLPRPAARLRRASVATALVGALALSACADLPGGVAASVNGQEVTNDFLGALVEAERLRISEAGTPAQEAQTILATYQRSTLSQVIVGMLLEQEADQRGINVTQEELDALWEEQVTIAGGEDALIARIEEIGLDEATARRQIAQGRLIELLQDDIRATIEVSQQDVRALYDQRAAQWDVATVSHIAVNTEAEAQEILALLDDGEATFTELAEQRSIDTQTGPLGGGLGEAPRGTYPEDFDNAIWSSEDGDVVGPIQTSFGFHVLRVDEIRTIAFEEMEGRLDEEIRGQLFQDTYNGLVTALIAESDVRVDGRFGEWDGLAGEVKTVDLFALAATA